MRSGGSPPRPSPEAKSVGRLDAHAARELQPGHARQRLRLGDEGVVVQVVRRDDGVHDALLADVPHEPARVHAADADEPVALHPRRQRLLGRAVGGRLAEGAHDEARHLGAVALGGRLEGAVVADVGVRHHHELADVAGVRQDLLIAAHGGVEAQLAAGLASGADGGAGEDEAVFEGDLRGCGLGHGAWGPDTKTASPGEGWRRERRSRGAVWPRSEIGKCSRVGGIGLRGFPKLRAPARRRQGGSLWRAGLHRGFRQRPSRGIGPARGFGRSGARWGRRLAFLASAPRAILRANSASGAFPPHAAAPPPLPRRARPSRRHAHARVPRGEPRPRAGGGHVLARQRPARRS